MVYAFAFLCLCWFCFDMFWCVCFVLLSSYEKTACISSHQSSIFEVCWLKGSLVFMFYDLVLIFLFLCCFVLLQSKQLSCIIWCLCCLFSFIVTRLSGVLVCILCLCFLVCCFVMDFCFSFLSKKPQKPWDNKNRKIENVERNTFLSVQLCSQIVFLFWVVG